MNGEPIRWCRGVASATPRSFVDFESQLVPIDAWPDGHRQRSPARASRTGVQMLFVEWSSSSMLEAGDSQPPSHLSQLRSAEQARVACASSREEQTRGSNTMICGDKQRLKKRRLFLIDRFAQGCATSCVCPLRSGASRVETARSPAKGKAVRRHPAGGFRSQRSAICLLGQGQGLPGRSGWGSLT